ncbi:Uncharacterized membrane-anchored protein YitT, contains DUF161 and DUF2179 domains [Clostridium amylolyticum]|uniref:Uncharacterized membrane-anchored protein YitT, contains DUF161 and DUF2179 domains n=1 Tax=Clostridium amylolyticum TaxID=1121298 RepID=A0A1M6JNN2_9CLOT|nr:YitT family protein [Clostridium amylolyticum]SHJ48173.1 Uncharacterized membrane-anchored protein YitT, contains DUF161 and DUF2179 domains [Clostridium amylolyticum]
MNYIKSRKTNIIDVVIIFIGCLIASLGVNVFLVHAKLLSGGATGLALIIQYLTRFKAGYTVFIINIPLFILSYFKLNKSFTYYSAIGMLSLSLSLIITEPLTSSMYLNDTLLYCIYGGVLCGIGYGLVFSRNGSTGGTDIITMLIRKKYTGDIGKVGFILNCIIITVGAAFFGLPKALYTLISIYIQGLVLDKVVKGLYKKQLLLIITEKEEEVMDYIIVSLHRGVTTLPAEGGYTQTQRKMLYCIVTLSQMVELRQTILQIDPKAFISIIDVSEVNGRGFKSI